MLKYRDANDPPAGKSDIMEKTAAPGRERRTAHDAAAAQIYLHGGKMRLVQQGRAEALCLPALFEPDHKDGGKQSRRSDL